MVISLRRFRKEHPVGDTLIFFLCPCCFPSKCINTNTKFFSHHVPVTGMVHDKIFASSLRQPLLDADPFTHADRPPRRGWSRLPHIRNDTKHLGNLSYSSMSCRRRYARALRPKSVGILLVLLSLPSAAKIIFPNTCNRPFTSAEPLQIVNVISCITS